MPDMTITVGHIVDNPECVLHTHYKIVTMNGEDEYETIYDSENEVYISDGPACDLLIMKVEYITVRDDCLLLEVRA